jgi:benzoylformate decarboxylase/acetolactate synthase-1/2/3 large subunit
MYGFDDPSRYFGISARASAQGWGAPAAIGVQIGRPNERVVAFVGDGGLMFTGSALYAAALWRLPIVFVVLGNGGWYDVAYGAQCKRGWTEDDLRHFGWRLDPAIDHAAFAASLGIRSEHVTAPDDLRPALQRASQHDGPAMLVVETDRKAIEYYLDWIQR